MKISISNGHEFDYVPTAGVETEEDLSNSRLDGDHTLSQVNVNARRRGRRSIDYTKPAYHTLTRDTVFTKQHGKSQAHNQPTARMVGTEN